MSNPRPAATAPKDCTFWAWKDEDQCWTKVRWQGGAYNYEAGFHELADSDEQFDHFKWWLPLDALPDPNPAGTPGHDSLADLPEDVA